MNLYEYIKAMPKAELHVHLEGSIQPATLLKLAKRNGVSLPAADVSGLKDFYHFRPDDYQLIAYEFGSECARQNIRYAEATFSIATNLQMTGLPWRAILDGLNAGRKQARDEFGVELRWILDIVRNNPETAEQVLDIALAARELGCVALGLGGSEADFPAGLFTAVFKKARQAGLPSVPHAGELSGPKSIWTAVDQLHAVRLQHGVRSIEDQELVQTLAQRQISLDICPTSNICLNVYPDFSSHPLRRLWDLGLLITIGSDDPPMFNTDLNQEYKILVDHFGFSVEELEQISLNGLRASLLPKAQRERMEMEFKAQFKRLREELS